MAASVKVSGGCLNSSPCIFTRDSRYMFLPSSMTVKVFSVKTGEVVRTLSTSPEEGGHADQITSVTLNPHNPLQLFTASLDGTIKVWDFNEETLLETHTVGVPISMIAVHKSSPDYIYLTTDKRSTKKIHANKLKYNSILLRYSVKPVKETSTESLGKYTYHQNNKRLVRMIKTRQAAGLRMSPDGSFLVLAARYKMHVWRLASDIQQVQLKTYMSQERITCLAFHPTEPCVAVGDETGKITLWYCFTPAVINRPVTSTLHWHAHKVNHLAFSDDGVYLLSGGEEATLVIWQLETGHRQFLPRLGAEIKSITLSPNQALYALGFNDNSVKVVNAVDLTLKQVVQGVRFIHNAGAQHQEKAIIAIEPRHHNVVLSGVPGALQFYNARNDRHVMELEVALRNKVSRTDEKEIVQPKVDLFAFFGNGEWMATVDSRNDEETTPELYLKFWQWDADAQNYVLNTRVDHPHKGPITSLQFTPSKPDTIPLAVTTSADKTFKIWQLQTQATRTSTTGDISWSCRSSGTFRDQEPTAASFSSDGSLLAVAYGHLITIWDPYTLNLHGALASPPKDHFIKRMTFLGVDSPYLVAHTKDHLYVWNLLNWTVAWNYRLVVNSLTADTHTPYFAISISPPALKSPVVLLFHPSSPVPHLVHPFTAPIQDMTFASPSQHGVCSNIVILTEQFELHELSLEPSEPMVNGIAPKEDMEKVNDPSRFTDIYGQTTISPPQQASVPHSYPSNPRTNLLNVPAQHIPPVESLFETFMESLMEIKQAS